VKEAQKMSVLRSYLYSRSSFALALVGLCVGFKTAAQVTVDSAALELEFRAATELSGPASIAELRIAPELELSLADSLKLRTSVRLISEQSRQFEQTGGFDLSGYSNLANTWATSDGAVALRDLYLDVDGAKIDWRVGKQQIVWGQLDGIKVLDVVNPQHFREFILPDFDQSRIGLWSVKADLKIARWNTEFFWAPDPTVHEFSRSSFAFLAPRFDTLRAWSLSPNRGVERASVSSDAAYGARASRLTNSGWDVSFVALSGLDPEPVVKNSELGFPIRLNQRRDVFGMSLSRSFGPAVWRLETSVQPGREFNLEDQFGTSARDQYTIGVALDFDGPGSWFTNVQLVHDQVQSGSESLDRPTQDTILTVSTKRSFAYDDWAFNIGWYASNNGDGLLRPALEYNLSDSIKWHIGADIFYGDGQGIFGQFDRLDRLSTTLSFLL